MTELILATRNKHKVREIKQILGKVPFKILSLLDFKDPSRMLENGRTFRENAVKKARGISKKYKAIALADDSGLQIQYLKGAPGVRSARFAGPKADSRKLCSKVLRLLKGVPKEKRRARFVCVAAIAIPEGKVLIVEGTCEGRITLEMRGTHGFGYDPIFVPRGYKKTFAEISPRLKNRLSHRGQAFRKARRLLLAI